MMFPNKKQKTASCENYKFNILNEEQKIQILESMPSKAMMIPERPTEIQFRCASTKNHTLKPEVTLFLERKNPSLKN